MLASGPSISRRVALPALAVVCALPASGQAAKCTVRPTNYKGWNAQQVQNKWVTLTFVPQAGGRLMQVTFGPHSYLFVNKRYEGAYFPPIEPGAPAKWYNYGGDKIWPLPEGTEDEKHWPGPLSDPLDDGSYTFSILSQGSLCKVRLDGPPDPRTGLQYSREVSLAADSPQISFHAVMKNASSRPIEWSLQSVTQYNTADESGRAGSSAIWAFTPVSEKSAYPGGYLVRSGNTSPPGLSVTNGMVALNYHFVENELWFDSRGGWLVVVDAARQYAMVERFHIQEGKEYPGKATVIFYTNGPGEPPDDALYYLEAEVNSPLVALQPGETYALDTEWYPARAGQDLLGVTTSGVIAEHLRASSGSGVAKLSGTFGVFFPGKIVARFLDTGGKQISETPLRNATPLEPVKLAERVQIPRAAVRVGLHLIDSQGRDRGALDEVSMLEGTHE